MHNVHNEYILLLCEAAEFERDMRTILLPGLLEHQQAIHEDATDRWKMILQDIYRSVSQFWYLTKRYFMFGILGCCRLYVYCSILIALLLDVASLLLSE